MKILFSTGIQKFICLSAVTARRNLREFKSRKHCNFNAVTHSGFKEILGRLRHPFLKLHLILSTNPVAKSNWTYKHFFELLPKNGTAAPVTQDWTTRDCPAEDEDDWAYDVITLESPSRYLTLECDYIKSIEEIKTSKPVENLEAIPA